MGDYADADLALAAIGKELEKNLNNWEAWSAKADVLLSIGMYEIAIRCCDRSLTLNPENKLAWLTKGKALERLGRHEEAKVCLERAKIIP